MSQEYCFHHRDAEAQRFREVISSVSLCLCGEKEIL
jgi:hypothetical protein